MPDRDVLVRRTEWRVVWQREGLSKRTARFRSRPMALRKALILQGRIHEVLDVDPEGYACCPGTATYECGCGGITHAESWAQTKARLPKMIYGPVIETREFSATPWESTDA